VRVAVSAPWASIKIPTKPLSICFSLVLRTASSLDVQEMMSSHLSILGL
jgi:hypothetical protein